ncbi:MAG: efflux RND transporter periplasmic adaptor subunit [Bacteroidota bacterium]|nr:HlyD family efflux transporter periplasmic adaptor subunit [Ignavibacteria bacterium]MCU7501152.1 HlyD family efflux transporter periplasmic adaptor subunit [Ignavibacteria bacterium]MCU7522221.1 HlyD family efflux transporter periplasmic adaptor subunit [Ignavibacteria bacterium]MCU7526508.1 HlyD family efflux transporter periplasmic adaptor subunit [Ignavibacteria bacterium]
MMDRKLEKKPYYKKKTFWAFSSGIALFLAFIIFILSDTETTLNVEKDKITISTVAEHEFEEFIPITGTTLPRTTFYLDAILGGSVEKIFVEEGAYLHPGDKILKLSNSNLQLSTLQQETGTFQQINEARNTRLRIEQNSTQLQAALVSANFNLNISRQKYKREKIMWDKKLTSEQEFENVRESYLRDLAEQKLAYQNFQQDSVLRRTQISQIDESIRRLQMNLELIRENIDKLTLRAPIGGQLTFLDAEIGQSKSPGNQLGQIDALDGFKVSADIDEYYIARVTTGLEASTEIDGKNYKLSVIKVFPGVKDGKFQVHLDFSGIIPPGLRRGQTLQIKLKLSERTRALLLPRGGFYQKSGGQWVYALSRGGKSAVRKNVSLGRQNPEYYEVINGLKPGDRVITSSYENFGDVEKLIIKN